MSELNKHFRRPEFTIMGGLLIVAIGAQSVLYFSRDFGIVVFLLGATTMLAGVVNYRRNVQEFKKEFPPRS